MQLCDATVRLNDSTSHTVFKTEITPPEILVLRQIHGEGAVVDIVHKSTIRRDHDEEWERLVKDYGRSDDGLMDAGNGDLLNKMFPGAQKRLPNTLDDIGLGHLVKKGRTAP